MSEQRTCSLWMQALWGHFRIENNLSKQTSLFPKEVHIWAEGMSGEQILLWNSLKDTWWCITETAASQKLCVDRTLLVSFQPCAQSRTIAGAWSGHLRLYQVLWSLMNGDAPSVVPPRAAPASAALTRTSLAALCSHSSYICRDMSKASYLFFSRMVFLGTWSRNSGKQVGYKRSCVVSRNRSQPDCIIRHDVYQECTDIKLI